MALLFASVIFFVCVFLTTCVLKFVKIKNTFIYICIFQKFFVPLQQI